MALKKNYILLFISFVQLLIISCETNFEEINANPNEPLQVNTNAIFNSATKELFDGTRNDATVGLVSLPWVQYWAQNNFIFEDLYDYRDVSAKILWETCYLVANDFKSIIDLNTNANTSQSNNALPFGSNDNQIAVARIMLAYTFHLLVDTFGDIPYYSFGSQDPDFQALTIKSTLTPAFASQEKIYIDLLKELQESSAQLDLTSTVFKNGDAIYNGDPIKWKKFANSLILRIANRFKNVNPEIANKAINSAIINGVFTSNADNAIQTYEDSFFLGSPLFINFFEQNNFRLGVTNTFINLLKGSHLDFGLDPRLFKYAAPNLANIDDLLFNELLTSEGEEVDEGNPDDYDGVPYAFFDVFQLPQNTYSYPSPNILKPNFGEVLMEYAEVAFILSEHNNWNQTEYLNGVKASLERWNVIPEKATAFISNLPNANQETVLTQKYIALYMQSHEAWAEYRRTGFPKTLLLPGELSFLSPKQTEVLGLEEEDSAYEFIPEIDIDNLPLRLRYPNFLKTTNNENQKKAINNLNNGDSIISKLIWNGI